MTARSEDPFDLTYEELARVAAFAIKRGMSHDSEDVRRFATEMHGIAMNVAGDVFNDSEMGETWYQYVVQLMQEEY